MARHSPGSREFRNRVARCRFMVLSGWAEEGAGDAAREARVMKLVGYNFRGFDRLKCAIYTPMRSVMAELQLVNFGH